MTILLSEDNECDTFAMLSLSLLLVALFGSNRLELDRIEPNDLEPQ